MKIFIHVFKIIPLNYIPSFVLYILVMVLSAIFDLIGLGSMVPFLGAMADPGLFMDRLSPYFSSESAKLVMQPDQMLMIIAIISISAFSLGLMLRALGNYLQIKFALSQEECLSSILFNKYLQNEFVWFGQRDSMELTKTITAEVSEFVTRALQPCLTLISQLIVILVFGSILIIYDPLATFSVMTFFALIYGVIFFFVKDSSHDLGILRKEANTKRFQVIRDAFREIRDIKVRGMEPHFLERFNTSAKQYSRSVSLGNLFADIPRYALEGIAFACAITVSVWLLNTGLSFDSVFTFILLYAIAGYRILPACQQVYASVTRVMYSASVIDTLRADLNETKGGEDQISLKSLFDSDSPEGQSISLPKATSIKFENVWFRYPNSSFYAIENLNLTVKKGEMVFIGGVSGSGKSTLLDLSAGLLTPTRGTCNASDFLRRRAVAYLGQTTVLTQPTIKQNIIFGSLIDQHDDAEILRLLYALGLGEKINQLPNGINTELGENAITLSGGQRQRLAICRAIYQKSDVLLLDEATSALDPKSEQRVIEVLKNELSEGIILFSSHRDAVRSFFSRVIMVDRGKLHLDSSDNIVTE